MLPLYPPWPLALALALVRVLVANALLFGWLTARLFPDFPDRGSAGFVGRAVAGLFLATAGVHLLAFTRLYEGLAVLGALFGALVWRRYLSRTPQERTALMQGIGVACLQWLDRWTGPRRSRARPALPDRPAPTSTPPVRLPPGEAALLALVLGVAAYMRFADGVAHPAPAFSDAPVTLKWMKSFGWGQLYPDGVYPEGMYAWLSLIKKLTFEESFLVMSVTGPLVGLGLVLSLALFLRWTTGSRLAAAAGALIYGTAPALLPGEMVRQAGYNSQEFGLLFALPAAWFAHRYLTGGERWHALAAAAAAGLAAFAHPVSLLISLGFAGAALLAAIAEVGVPWRRMGALLLLGGGAGALAALPPLVGLTILGRSWHGSSVAFLGTPEPLPLFVPPAYLLVILGLGLAAALLPGPGKAGSRLAAATGLGGLALWLLPHALGWEAMVTLTHRTPEAGSIAISLLAGLGWSGLERVLGGPLVAIRSGGGPALLTRLTAGTRALPALLAALALALWWLHPPQPLRPPRISTDEAILQFLRLDRNLTQGDWMLVMEEPGYALALGRAEHQYPGDLLRSARMGASGWCWEDERGIRNGPRQIAILIERNRPSGPALLNWVERYRNRVPAAVVHAGPGVELWLISYPVDPGRQKAEMWGERPASCTVEPLT